MQPLIPIHWALLFLVAFASLHFFFSSTNQSSTNLAQFYSSVCAATEMGANNCPEQTSFVVGQRNNARKKVGRLILKSRLGSSIMMDIVKNSSDILQYLAIIFMSSLGTSVATCCPPEGIPSPCPHPPP